MLPEMRGVVLVALVACSSPERAPTRPTEPIRFEVRGESTAPPSTAAAAADPAPAAAPAAAATPATIEMTFAGDVMFGRFVEDGFRAIRAEKLDPFAQIAPLLRSDLALVNLETPVMRDPPTKPIYGHLMRFVTTPARVQTLVDAGVKYVSIANNHYWDMKKEGALTTPELLAEMGITAIGVPRAEPPYFRVDTVVVAGWKIGFVAGATECNTSWETAAVKIPWAERPKIGKALVPVIEAARADHDLVIPVLHWGKEYLDAPERWQVIAAHAWIDAGADVVIAHHPHVIQGIERYKDGLIAYSLGNLLFDNTSSNRKWGGVLRLTFERAAGASRACIRAAQFNPTLVKPQPGHHVTIADGKAFDAIAHRLRTTSKAKGINATEWTVDGDKLTTPGTCAP
jgi:poly-gamma-glutamate synthesis protein (capsule biosynthesis protein)